MIPPNLTSLVLASLGVYFLFRFVLLSLTLWAMLQTQDLNYNIPGMLASAALASVCDMVPIVGHPLAVSVLFLCVLKLTGGHFVDVRFTVAVSYAVMFLLQMVILSVLPNPSHTPVHARGLYDAPSSFQAGAKTAGDYSDSDDSVAPTAKPKTPAVSQTKPKAPAKTNVTTASIAAANTTSAKVPPAAPEPDYAKKWKLKGVVGSGNSITAMIGVGGKTYTIGLGDRIKVPADNGTVEVSMDAAAENAVVLNAGGSRFTLSLK